jgi:hypothetical protein
VRKKLRPPRNYDEPVTQRRIAGRRHFRNILAVIARNRPMTPLSFDHFADRQSALVTDTTN